VQVLRDQLPNACACLTSSQEQDTVLTKRLAGGTSSRQQTSKSDAGCALHNSNATQRHSRHQAIIADTMCVSLLEAQTAYQFEQANLQLHAYHLLP
jgi:hypothetical protein